MNTAKEYINNEYLLTFVLNEIQLQLTLILIKITIVFVMDGRIRGVENISCSANYVEK